MRIEVKDKVVCICVIQERYRAIYRANGTPVPSKGGIYCVSGVAESRADLAIIYLVGMSSRPDKNGDTYGYLAEWFRKIVPASERNAEAEREKA